MIFEVNEHGWKNKQFYPKGVFPTDITQADSIFDTSTDQIKFIFAFSLKLSPIIFFPHPPFQLPHLGIICDMLYTLVWANYNMYVFN